MQKVTEQDGKSLDLIDENLKALKTIFPEAFTEDGIDFDVLRQLLGDSVAEGDEKYGLTWYGKKKARQIALTPSLGTLRPCPEESVDWDTTQNLFIEGDNLEVLKLLKKSYANKVKMIYIDPPYNTGNEFIYPDNFKDNLETYLRYTGQKDDKGFKTSSNTERSGRYHTNWLSMMYPRLRVARDLLQPDGVIVISIDDNEASNLRKICDELFGEENFVANAVWQKAYVANMTAKHISNTHDHILIYCKNIDRLSFGRFERTQEQIDKFKNPDNDPRGPWKAENLSAGKYYSAGMFKITTPKGKTVSPPQGRYWRCNEETYNKWLKDGRIWFGVSGKGRPMLKKYFAEVKEGLTPETWWGHKDFGSNKEASISLKSLFDGIQVFDTPKPVKLLRQISTLMNNSNGIFLDFFPGSCTTAHAIMDLNRNDNGKRKFIMIQLPELCSEKSEAYKASYKTIADIGKERIRRASAKIKEENPDYRGDLGFKVFKLDSSNIRAWNPDRSDIEKALIDHMEHLVKGRSEQDVLYELLLKRGVELTVPIENRNVAGKDVYSIGYGVLFACLDTSIKRDEVEELAQGIIEWHGELEPAGDTQVVFRDSAFENDVAKTNMAAILAQHGIAHVRSL